MLTPGHAIVNMAIISGNKKKTPFAPIVWGAILPDLSMVGFYVWNRWVMGFPSKYIWGELYFTHEWMAFFDVFHSFPLIAAAAAVAYFKKLRRSFYFFLSMFLHSVFDLPLHNDDAHRHFFPLSLYKFKSPFSYWDPEHHGRMMTFLEVLLVIILSIGIWPKIESKWGKALIIAVNLFYIAVAFLHKM